MTKISFIIFLIFLPSCAVKIKNLEQYTQSPLLELEEMPSKEEINSSLPRVLFIAEKPNAEKLGETNAHIVIKNDLESLLSSKKFASIVEREKSDAFKEEMSIAEFEGKNIPSIQSVDYIFEVSISDVTFSSKHSLDAINIGAELLLFAAANSKNQEITYTPSLPKTKYKYTSIVDGNIKIYKIPSMELIKTVPLHAQVTDSEVASTGSGIKVGIINIDTSQPIDAKKDDSNLVYKAIKLAIKNATPEIKSFLNKKGYIMAKKTLKNNAIFQINRGKDDGFDSQNKVQIMRYTAETNPLTEEEDTIAQKICEGVVTNQISENRSWVIFEKDCQENIRLGDKVTVLY